MQPMRVGDFEIGIVGAQTTADPAVVELQHGQIYQIALTNHGKLRCDVQVRIDANDVGIWRIQSAKTIVVERPVDHTGRFTFYQLVSAEAKSLGLPATVSSGFLRARFVPESAFKGKLFPDESALFAAPVVPITEHSGGTTYSGKSEQIFRDADDIYSFDEASAVTIKIVMKCSFESISSNATEYTMLRGEIAQLKLDADKASDEEFDFCKARHLDNLRFEKLRQLDRLESWSTSPKSAVANYEKEGHFFSACPDCTQQTRVPAGQGKIRIKCPTCSCQFVRET